MSGSVAKEFELKVELDREDCDRLERRVRRLQGEHGPSVLDLRSVYFDTSDHALRNAGMSLRLRDNGGRRLQTLKVGTQVVAGISNPLEIEFETVRQTPDISAIPDDIIRERIRKLVGRNAIEPVFETHIRRTALMFHGAGATAELALDRGEIVAGGLVRPIIEVELELHGGEAEAMLELARKLFDGIPLRLSTESKAGRGYGLAAGKPRQARSPARGAPPRLEAGMGAGEAYRRIAATLAGQIIANRDALLAGDDPEAAHQLRVGLRRMRVALDAFRSIVPERHAAHLDNALRKAGRIAGELRDREVLLGELVRPILSHMPERAIARPLEQWLREDLAHTRRVVRRRLDSARLNDLQIGLAAASSGIAVVPGAGTRPVKAISDLALAECWAKVAARARGIRKLDDEGRHRLRKALKNLRYTVEFFEALYPPASTGVFIEATRTLQDGFGFLNDVTLARRLPDMIDSRAPDRAMRAAHFVIGWHSARFEREWDAIVSRWNILRRQPRFWIR